VVEGKMMRNLLIVLFLLIMIFTVSCDSSLESQKLTLEVVQKLSEKGDKLSWEDFKKYDSDEIGSGLHILMYQIDDKFALFIGGVFEEKPMYINLAYNYNAPEGIGMQYIDIRYENVDEFIKSHPQI
jgi:hypothetical protein